MRTTFHPRAQPKPSPGAPRTRGPDQSQFRGPHRGGPQARSGGHAEAYTCRGLDVEKPKGPEATTDRIQSQRHQAYSPRGTRPTAPRNIRRSNLEKVPSPQTPNSKHFSCFICRLSSVVCCLLSVVCRLSSVVSLLSYVVCRMSSVVCRLLSIVCRLSSAVYRLLSVVCRLSSVVCRLSPGVWRLSSVVCRLSFVVCRLPFVVCRLSSVVCRLSFFVCRLSPVVSRLPSVV